MSYAATRVSKAGPRIAFLDGARATAMLFVFASHFAGVFLADETWAPIASLVTQIASPTFVVLSGVMLGFLWETRNDRASLRVRLADRGLFLLTIGHLLIAGSYLLREHEPALQLPLRHIFTTDVIGVCMILQPWLISVLKPKVHLALGAAVFILSWGFIAAWHPQGIAGMAVEETLFGSESPFTTYLYAFPLLPWVGLNTAGVVLGKRLGELRLQNDESGMQRLLWRAGGWSIAGAIALKVAYIAVRPFVPLSTGLFLFTDPFQKYPPSLAYFLFYGGIGAAAFLGGWLYLERRGVMLGWAAGLGQTSLVMFITQSYVYYIGGTALQAYLPERYWPVWFVASIVLIAVPALIWHKRGWNRFLTIGFRQYFEKRDELRAQHASISA